MESKNFSAMNFEEQVTLLYDLADGWNILHAKLVFKVILNAIKAVGYSYTYQKNLAIKTLKSMLNDVEEKYGIESAQYREIAILYHIILKG
jgi:hypothetical protein